VNRELHRDIIQCLPHLRAFSFLLARDPVLAEDLVQEAVMRALAHAHQFQPGTNFKAWVTAILRNGYFNEMRRLGRARRFDREALWSPAVISGGQEEHLEMRDFIRAFQSLSDEHREALLLVGACGYKYEDAAKIAACAVGTMKSRVSRARQELQRLLDLSPAVEMERVPQSVQSPH
jgi:RNA polymerase sigma-70 factor (ECF subfamily)